MPRWKRLLGCIFVARCQDHGDGYVCPVCRILGPREPDLLALMHAEERVMLKAISLRERHDALLDALTTLVAMHRGGPNAVGNWDTAIDQAEKALALSKAPLLESTASGAGK